MKDVKHLAAELALLREYDRVRTHLGHYYGGGQVGSELGRRQRELESACFGDVHSAYELERDAPREDLLAAFQRIGKPRLRRIVRDNEQWGITPSSGRSETAWRRIAQWVGATV